MVGPSVVTYKHFGDPKGPVWLQSGTAGLLDAPRDLAKASKRAWRAIRGAPRAPVGAQCLSLEATEELQNAQMGQLMTPEWLIRAQMSHSRAPRG